MTFANRSPIICFLSAGILFSGCGKTSEKGKNFTSVANRASIKSAFAPTERDLNTKLPARDEKASVVCLDGLEKSANNITLCKQPALILSDGTMIQNIGGGAVAGSPAEGNTGLGNSVGPIACTPTSCQPVANKPLKDVMDTLLPGVFADFRDTSFEIVSEPARPQGTTGESGAQGAGIKPSPGGTAPAVKVLSNNAVEINGVKIEKDGTVTSKDGRVFNSQKPVVFLKDQVIVRKDGTIILADPAGRPKTVSVTDPATGQTTTVLNVIGQVPAGPLQDNPIIKAMIDNYEKALLEQPRPQPTSLPSTKDTQTTLPANGSTSPTGTTVSAPTNGSTSPTGTTASAPTTDGSSSTTTNGAAPAPAGTTPTESLTSCAVTGYGTLANNQTLMRKMYRHAIEFSGECVPEIQSTTCHNGVYSWSGTALYAACFSFNTMKITNPSSSTTSVTSSSAGQGIDPIGTNFDLQTKKPRLRKECVVGLTGLPACTKRVFCESGSSTSSGCKELSPSDSTANTYRGSPCTLSTKGTCSAPTGSVFTCKADLTFDEATDAKCQGEELLEAKPRLKKLCTTTSTSLPLCQPAVYCNDSTSTSTGCKETSVGSANTYRGSPCASPQSTCRDPGGRVFQCTSSLTFAQTTDEKCGTTTDSTTTDSSSGSYTIDASTGKCMQETPTGSVEAPLLFCRSTSN